MIERKCLNCGTWNKAEDSCVTCGRPLSQKEIDRIKTVEQAEIERQKPKSSFILFTEKLENHRFLAVRIFYKIAYSIGVVFAAIGAFFAWMTALANA